MLFEIVKPLPCGSPLVRAPQVWAQYCQGRILRRNNSNVHVGTKALGDAMDHKLGNGGGGFEALIVALIALAVIGIGIKIYLM